MNTVDLYWAMYKRQARMVHKWKRLFDRLNQECNRWAARCDTAWADVDAARADLEAARAEVEKRADAQAAAEQDELWQRETAVALRARAQALQATLIKIRATGMPRHEEFAEIIGETIT